MRQRGFTLIEVCLSMLLVGLLGSGLAGMLRLAIVVPIVSQANMELANLKQSAVRYYNTNNETATDVSQLYAAGHLRGQYQVSENGSIEGIIYPSCSWDNVTGRWILATH